MQRTATRFLATALWTSTLASPFMAYADDSATAPSQAPAAPAGAQTEANAPPVAVDANTSGATDAVRRANDKLRTLLGDKSDKSSKEITKELHGLLDIGLLAQRSLASHWDKMTGKQRTEIVTTLQQIIEKKYLGELRDNVDYKIDYLGEEAKGDSVLVKSAIRAQRNGRPSKVSMDYRLKQEGSQWHIYDFIIEDASILENYRSQFSKIIAKDGVDGLITKMKSKLQA